MSVHERSHGTAGRPVSRPVGGALCALAVLAPLGAGVPAAAAADEQQAVMTPSVQAAPQPAEPQVEPPAESQVEPPAEPQIEAPAEPQIEPPAEPPVELPAEPQGEPQDEPPAEPQGEPPAEPQIDLPAHPDPPAEPRIEPLAEPDPPAERRIAPPAQHDSPAEREGDPGADPPAPPGSTAVARNESTIIQAVWQVQRGCETYCWGTSQTQSVTQQAGTTQAALASAGAAPSSEARALNTSLTLQFAWQLQIGCVAFCYDTRQEQIAAQTAQTEQLAVALAAAAAWAENVAGTIQQVWQYQQGCRQECFGTAQTQAVVQQQGTDQETSAVTVALPPFPGTTDAPEVPAWLIALALNAGATIQVILQNEESACRQYCSGDVQVQTAFQAATTEQEAVALVAFGGAPEAPVEPGTVWSPATPEIAASVALAMAGPAAPAVAAPRARETLGLVVRTRAGIAPRGPRIRPSGRLETLRDLRLAAAAATVRIAGSGTSPRPSIGDRSDRVDSADADARTPGIAGARPPLAAAAQPYDAVRSNATDPGRIALLTLGVVSLTYAGTVVRRRRSGPARRA